MANLSAELTRHPMKDELYSHEPYMRETCVDVAEILGSQADRILLNHGLVLVKPDGYDMGLTTATLEAIESRGFMIGEARRLFLSPTMWRTLWAFQLPQASLDRILVNDLIATGPAIALVIRGRENALLPAAVELSAFKGPATPAQQSQDCLRRVLGQPNRIFSLVHSADEPIDLVRELAILFDRSDRRQILRAMLTPGLDSPATALVAELRMADEKPRRRFDIAHSRAVVQHAVDLHLHEFVESRANSAALLRQGRHALETGTALRIGPFFGALGDAALDVDPWHLAVAFSDLIPWDEIGKVKLIDNLGTHSWTKRTN